VSERQTPPANLCGPFKGIICGDIFEFESDHLSQAVGSPPDRIQDGVGSSASRKFRIRVRGVCVG
jgi:hypothetical protein